MGVAIHVIGWSGAGKTALICRVLPELRARGFTVAVVKHTGHPHPLHKDGSDTAAFERSGAAPVVFATPSGLEVIRAGDSESLLPPLIASLPADLVLIEGWKDGPYPKIEVWRKGIGEPLYRSRTDVLAVVTDDPLDGAIQRFGTAEVAGVALFLARRVKQG